MAVPAFATTVYSASIGVGQQAGTGSSIGQCTSTENSTSPPATYVAGTYILPAQLKLIKIDSQWQTDSVTVTGKSDLGVGQSTYVATLSAGGLVTTVETGIWDTQTISSTETLDLNTGAFTWKRTILHALVASCYYSWTEILQRSGVLAIQLNQVPQPVGLTLTIAQPSISPSREPVTDCYGDVDNTACGQPGTTPFDAPAQYTAVLLTASLTQLGGTSVPVPAVGHTITFSATNIDVASAGHAHANPPVGIFQWNLQSPVLTCQTDAAGACELYYQPSINSGRYQIKADAGGGLSDTKTVDVLVPGLDQLPISLGGDYVLTGAPPSTTQPACTANPHPNNHFGTYYLRAAIQAVAAEYHKRTGDVLGINDMSLPWGGVFDLACDWQRSHLFHRLGTSVDIDRHLTPANRIILHALMVQAGLVEISEKSLHYEVMRP